MQDIHPSASRYVSASFSCIRARVCVYTRRGYSDASKHLRNRLAEYLFIATLARVISRSYPTASRTSLLPSLRVLLNNNNNRARGFESKRKIHFRGPHPARDRSIFGRSCLGIGKTTFELNEDYAMPIRYAFLAGITIFIFSSAFVRGLISRVRLTCERAVTQLLAPGCVT